MKKYILKILIFILFLAPFVLYAEECREYGEGGVLVPCEGEVDVFGVPKVPAGSGGGGIPQTPEGKSDATQPETPPSGLYVETQEASEVTFTSARLSGEGNNSSLPTTAYFRYSRAEISPVYCNDIYGSNMRSTGDIKLGSSGTYDILLSNGLRISGAKGNTLEGGKNSFYYVVTDLSPDTTYYYCAITSDSEGIVYGGQEIVKSFHTSPLKTNITTNGASGITTDEAVLSATLSSLDKTTTSFEYRKINTNGAYSEWETVEGSKSVHSLDTGKNNIYKKITFKFKNLTSNTTYQYRGVAEIDSIDTGGVGRGSQNKTIYGKPVTFRTGRIQETIVRTLSASSIRDTSARLNGSYISIKSIEINFEYREKKENTDDVSNPWRTVSTQTYSNTTGKAVSKNVNANLSGLTKDTVYQFRVSGDTGLSTPYYGAVFEFRAGSQNGTVIDRGGGGVVITPPTPTGCTAPLVYNIATRSCVDPASDLTASSVYPNTAYAGVAKTYTATISNIGYLEARNAGGDSFIEHLFQWDIDADHSSISGMSFEKTDGSIAKNGTARVSTSITFSTTGTKYVRVCADSNDLFVSYVSELNENNNCGPWTLIRVTANPPTCESPLILNRSRDACITPPRTCTLPQIYNFATESCTDPAPDLTATVVSPTFAYDNVAQTYTANIRNVGPIEAKDQNGDGFIEHLIQWDNDVDHTTVDTHDYVRTYGTILPDEEAVISKPYTLTGVGNVKYVRVCADSNDVFVNNISELNEGNNCGQWARVEVRTKPGIIDNEDFPKVTITATPSSVNPGGTSVIKWTSTNTKSCDAGMGTNNGVTGSYTTGPLTKSKSFRVVCTGDKGRIGAYVYVSVKTTDNGDDKLPTVSVLATPSSIASGESSTISWTSTNTTSCDAGPGNGTGTSGSFNTGPLTKGKSFAVSCDGENGQASFYTFVQVVSDGGGGGGGGNDDPGDEECVETDTTDCDDGNGGGGNGGGGDGNNDNDDKDGVWTRSGDGKSGTWGSGNSSGTWQATSGTGGSGSATWTSNGDGTGTWTGPNGSGTWRTTFGDPGSNGGWNDKKLGDTATPPWDAIVRYHEGIETVFARQIVNRKILQDVYGYDGLSSLQEFAWTMSDVLAKRFGYINPTRKEVRVVHPDRAAYELQILGDRLMVYEYFDYMIVDIRDVTAEFKDIADYEYYYQKK